MGSPTKFNGDLMKFEGVLVFFVVVVVLFFVFCFPQEMQDNYTFLLSVYEKVLDRLRHGVLAVVSQLRQASSSPWFRHFTLCSPLFLFIHCFSLLLFSPLLTALFLPSPSLLPSSLSHSFSPPSLLSSSPLLDSPGKQLCTVYNSALEFIESERPDLKDHFTRNIGYVSRAT